MSKHRRHRRHEYERRVNSNSSPISNGISSLLSNINRDDVIALISKLLLNQNSNSSPIPNNNVNRYQPDAKAENDRTLEMLNSLRPLVGEQNVGMLDKMIEIYSGKKEDENEISTAPTE